MVFQPHNEVLPRIDAIINNEMDTQWKWVSGRISSRPFSPDRVKLLPFVIVAMAIANKTLPLFSIRFLRFGTKQVVRDPGVSQ